MIEIVASVCLAVAPGACKDITLTFVAERPVTVQQCFQYGQIELAKWSEGHPGWRVARWRCGRPAGIAKI